MPNQPKRDPFWAIALSGFVGAAGPSLCQLIAIIQKEPANMPHFNFFIGMVLLGALGGGIALIAKETVAWKAFSMGMSAPTIFSSTATVAISVAMIGPIEYMGAYADTPVIEQEQDTVQVRDSVDLTIEVEDGRKTNIITGGRVYRIQHQQTFRVPAQEELIIEDEEAQTTYTPTKDSNRIRVQVQEHKAKGSFWKGLLPLSGEDAHRKISPKSIEVQEIEQEQDQLQEER